MVTTRLNLKKIIAFILMILSLLLISISYNRMIGSFYEFLVTKHINFWAEQSELPNIKDLDIIDAFYHKALQKIPNSPDLLESGGMLAEWYAYAIESDEHQSRAYYQLALERYQLSIEQRPTWPYTWFDIVKVKLILGEPDGEFLNALSKSITLGPNEPDIQLGVIQIGLMTWDFLDQENQNSVMMTFYNMLANKPTTLFNTVEEYELLGPLKLILSQSDKEMLLPALSSSLVIGEGAPDIQVGVIQIGLITWEKLDQSTQDLIMMTIYNLLVDRSQLLFTKVQESELSDALEFILSQPDNLFAQQLLTSLELDEDTPNSQVDAVQVGLLTWDRLDKTTQDRIITTIYQLLAYRPDDLFKAVQKHKLWDLVCQFSINNIQVNQKCR